MKEITITRNELVELVKNAGMVEPAYGIKEVQGVKFEDGTVVFKYRNTVRVWDGATSWELPKGTTYTFQGDDELEDFESYDNNGNVVDSLDRHPSANPIKALYNVAKAIDVKKEQDYLDSVKGLDKESLLYDLYCQLYGQVEDTEDGFVDSVWSNATDPETDLWDSVGTLTVAWGYQGIYDNVVALARKIRSVVVNA